MKRIILSITGTIAGLVGLITFKTQFSTAVQQDVLPLANADNTSATTTPSSNGAITEPTSPAPTTQTPSESEPSSSPASSSSAAATGKDASATGDAITNRYGVVQVKVTESGGKISNVEFVQLTAFDPRSQQINSQAGPILLQETIDAQGADINGVSGATYTSDSYLTSLQSALDQLP